MKNTSTKTKILTEGRSLLQKHGYNGFSFQDIANLLEIKKPSLYDHYSSKEELIIAILSEYGIMFDGWTPKVKDFPAPEKIRKVFEVFYSFSCDGKKVCPVLALITDLKVLSKPIQNSMKSFIDKWLFWLNTVITEGQACGQIRTDINAKALSQLIYSQVMGAQLQSRIKNTPELIRASAELIVILITAKP